MNDIIPAIPSLPDKKMPFKRWAQIGMNLRTLQGEIRWAIGDWMAYGERWYGEDVHQVTDMWDEYSQQSLSNMKYTSVEFPPFRRRMGVSWSNHAELRTKPEAEQERWLDKLENGATRDDVREAYRIAPPRPHCKSCTCYE